MPFLCYHNSRVSSSTCPRIHPTTCSPIQNPPQLFALALCPPSSLPPELPSPRPQLYMPPQNPPSPVPPIITPAPYHKTCGPRPPSSLLTALHGPHSPPVLCTPTPSSLPPALCPQHLTPDLYAPQLLIPRTPRQLLDHLPLPHRAKGSPSPPPPSHSLTSCFAQTAVNNTPRFTAACPTLSHLPPPLPCFTAGSYSVTGSNMTAAHSEVL